MESLSPEAAKILEDVFPVEGPEPKSENPSNEISLLGQADAARAKIAKAETDRRNRRDFSTPPGTPDDYFPDH